MINLPFPFSKLIWSAILILAFSFTSHAQNQRDTVHAQVVYGGDDAFLGLDTLSIEEIKAYRDSLLMLPHPPQDKVDQLQLFLAIHNMTFEEVYDVIDSLLDLDEIPVALINELNKYIALHPVNEDKFADEHIDTTIYPADFYYHDWNTLTPNPYNSTQLSKGDSVIELQLVQASSQPQFVIPIDNVITSEFGYRDGRPHKGIDIDLEVWDPVVSSFSGMVRIARTYGGYGRVVVVRHFNGLETLYAHLHRIKVKPGQIVKAGDVIGLGGSSGHSSGSHLHWEVRFKGVPINPLNFIDYENQRLIHSTLILHKTKHGYAAFPKGSVYYSVKRGDYLYKIAAQYGTTVNALCALNGIRRNSPLYVGQKLRVL